MVMINILIFTKTDRTSNNTGQHIIRKDNEKGGEKSYNHHSCLIDRKGNAAGSMQLSVEDTLEVVLYG